MIGDNDDVCWWNKRSHDLMRCPYYYFVSFIDEAFLNHAFYYKVWYMLVTLSLTRTKYYFAWTLSKLYIILNDVSIEQFFLIILRMIVENFSNTWNVYNYSMLAFTYMYFESCMEVHVLMQTVLIFMLHCYGLTKGQQCKVESDWRQWKGPMKRNCLATDAAFIEVRPAQLWV